MNGICLTIWKLQMEHAFLANSFKLHLLLLINFILVLKDALRWGQN